jgi:hypothetical protein
MQDKKTSSKFGNFGSRYAVLEARRTLWVFFLTCQASLNMTVMQIVLLYNRASKPSNSLDFDPTVGHI